MRVDTSPHGVVQKVKIRFMLVGSPYYDNIPKTSIIKGLTHPTVFICFINNLDFLDTLSITFKERSMILKILRLKHNRSVPEYKTVGAAGMDLCAAISEPVTLQPLERTLIPTGLKIELEHGYEAQIRPRSGMSIKHGITLINCVGTIDEDYRGEVCVPVVNISNEAYTIQPEERIAQMVIAKYEQAEIQVVTELSSTERGTGGFGSTGK